MSSGRAKLHTDHNFSFSKKMTIFVKAMCFSCLHSNFTFLPWVLMRFLRSSLISFLKIYAYINGTIIFLEVFQPPNGLTGRNFCGEPSVSELRASSWRIRASDLVSFWWNHPSPLGASGSASCIFSCSYYPSPYPLPGGVQNRGFGRWDMSTHGPLGPCPMAPNGSTGIL